MKDHCWEIRLTPRGEKSKVPLERRGTNDGEKWARRVRTPIFCPIRADSKGRKRFYRVRSRSSMDCGGNLAVGLMRGRGGGRDGANPPSPPLTLKAGALCVCKQRRRRRRGWFAKHQPLKGEEEGVPAGKCTRGRGWGWGGGTGWAAKAP